MISIRLLNKLFGYFVLLLALLGLLIFYVINNPGSIKNISYIKKTKVADSSIDFIEKKALFLNPYKLDVAIPLIKNEIEGVKIENRPDSEITKDRFLLKFKQAANAKKVFENEKLYICPSSKGFFDFSDEKTALSMSIKSVNSNEIETQIVADLKEIGLEKNICESFVLEPLELSCVSKAIESDLQKLYSAKWWGIDKFYKIYKKENKLERLEIEGSLMYLNIDDILIYKDGLWQKTKDDENTQKYPIAKIRNKNKENLQIDVWNVDSDKYLFTIPIQAKQYMSRSDQFITSARKRTKTYVRCQIDKQTLIVKEKDIILKKEARWKVLKKNIAIEDIKNEELFYFDKVENKNDKSYLIGYLFSPMRTNYKKIEIPISSVSNHKRLKKRIIK
ncbi:MAG: hypothetical protein KR126chlam6_00661 [Candidatus Anoxychlamydiales bacterium]|nr:hypothetical protein [Candidatus Anoxychlamydiales bacterium]